jgi:hypothetical protein
VRRREFITFLCSGAIAWPRAAEAQQPVRMPQLGVLLVEENDPDVQARLTGFRHGPKRLGWSHGRNILADYHFGEDRPDRFQPRVPGIEHRPNTFTRISPSEIH